MKIRLLNDGGYGDMSDVKFPVEVDARIHAASGLHEVSGAEIIRVGGIASKWASYHYYAWDCDVGEAEIVE
jgi:hypothetical protein